MRKAEQGHLEDIRALRASCAASEALASRTKELKDLADRQGRRGTERESALQKRVAELEAAHGAPPQMEAELQELWGRVAQEEREREVAQRGYSETLEQLRSCRRR